MSIFQNAAKPKGLFGKMMVTGMNSGHAKMAEYGFSFVDKVEKNAVVLEAGCGGGANIKRWLKRCPEGKVFGLDYSEISVNASIKHNKKAVEKGRCEIVQANIQQIPHEDEKFDWVSAFETVYFWPNIIESFKEVRRVLKTGGCFLICNECNGHDKPGNKFAQIIDGMTNYEITQLKDYLTKAGFSSVQTYEKEGRSWICLIAKK